MSEAYVTNQVRNPSEYNEWFAGVWCGGRKQQYNRGQMKINKVSVIAALALGGFLATSHLAMAQDQKGGQGQRRGGGSVEQRMERMNEQLKLTDEQKPKVKAVLEESQKARQELRSESSGAPQDRREKMRGIMEKE